MSQLLAVLDAIIGRIKHKLPTVDCEYFPENPATYRLNHPVGAVLVSYTGSGYADPRATQSVAQQRSPRITLTICVRQLNGRSGAVEALEHVCTAVLGWKPPNCIKPIRAVSDAFLGHATGLWQYALTIGVEMLVVEDSVFDDAPLLNRIDWEQAPAQPAPKSPPPRPCPSCEIGKGQCAPVLITEPT